jgi:hypothetical protein
LLRRVVSRASLPQSADRVIRRLVDAGLLTTKDGTIELAHERLINDWPKLPLKTWLAQDATDHRLIDQLRQRASDDTLPDGLLAQTEELLQRDHELATEEPEIAKLVKRSRDEKRKRERRWWIALCGVLLVAFLSSLPAPVPAPMHGCRRARLNCNEIERAASSWPYRRAERIQGQHRQTT